MENNRVKLQDTTTEAVTKMVEGNPGALHVSMELLGKEFGFVHYLKLDDYGIYGCRIWMCYRDLCGSNIGELYNLLKNNSLQEAIKEKCRQDEGFAMEWEYYKSKERG